MDIKGFIVYILLIIFKRPERMPIILFSIFNDDNFKLYQLLNEIRMCYSFYHPSVIKGDHRSQLISVIEQLIIEWKTHIQQEDNLMQFYFYPKADLHISNHLKILKLLELYRFELVTGVSTILDNRTIYFRKLIVNHIKNDDREFDRYIFKKQY